METNRITTALATFGGLAFSAGAALACGPWFEERPPTLPFYLHRLPAKTIDEIYQETMPPAAHRYLDFPSEVEKLRAQAGRADTGSLLKKFEVLILAARERSGSTWWAGAGLSNLLIDLRDAAASGAKAAELEPYFKWRVEHADWFGLQTKPGEMPPQNQRWYGDQPDVPWDRVAEIDQQLAKASPELRPCWIYLHGALEFKSGEDIDSKRWFKRVLDEFPKHPRAEAAAFMEARCTLSESRGYTFDRPGTSIVSYAKRRAEAVELFRAYREKYPHGRFAADAVGWLGALAFDAEDYARALEFYIEQTEMPEHPELLVPALHMCERALSHIAAAPDDGAFAAVAEHPRIAMSMVYFIVNTTEADDFDGKFDEIERVKGWRKNVLPQLAHAVAARQGKYHEDDWPPRCLALLAEAASGGGDQTEALRLTDLAGSKLTDNDDVLFARGVALQRASRLSEAVETFGVFLKKFPHSPLARGTRLRMALALADDHRAGRAVVELDALEDKTATHERDDDGPGFDHGENVSDAEPEQVAQLVDTLLNFAPLEELAAPLADPNLTTTLRLELSETLAERYLAREDFAHARRYLTPAEWELQAAEIEKLTARAAAAPGAAEKGDAFFELAEAWAKARRKLLAFPLDSAETRRGVANDFGPVANFQRRENAKALFSKVDGDAEMESREELQHAFNYWLKAADAQPATDLAARALWRALAAIARIADASPFSLQRAVETDAAALSRRLYERLRGECPNSHEARDLAVYWNFPDPRRDDGSPARREIGGWDDVARASMAGGPEEERYPDVEKWRTLIARMTGLDQLADKSEALRKEVNDLREEARAQHKSIEEAFLLNFLDDVALFLQRPELTPEVRRRYLQLRIECLRRSAWEYWNDLHEETPEGVDPDEKLRAEIHAAQKNPAMKPAGEFLDFLDLGVIANHLIDVKVEGVEKDGEPLTYRSRDYGLLEKMTAVFLAKFPESSKREAALLLQARAIYMLSRPVFYKRSVEWPEANRMEGSVPPQFHQREKFEAKRVLDALDAYDRHFPAGQYAATIRSYRADVLARLHDWPRALELTLSLLDDDRAPEMHEEAAVRLSRIFEQLADDGQRATLLRAIKPNERLCGLLHEFLKIESDEHPLLYLKQYFSDEIGRPLRD